MVFTCRKIVDTSAIRASCLTQNFSEGCRTICCSCRTIVTIFSGRMTVSPNIKAVYDPLLVLLEHGLTPFRIPKVTCR